jgi:hypothetical protein
MAPSGSAPAQPRSSSSAPSRSAPCSRPPTPTVRMHASSSRSFLPSLPPLGDAHFSIHRRPDRVFSPECSTAQVYEEGAKEVALSVLAGINCTRRIMKSFHVFALCACGLTFSFLVASVYSACACSQHIRVRPDEQREDVHDGRHHGAQHGRNLRLHR